MHHHQHLVKAIIYSDGHLKVLNQLVLPHQTVYEEVEDADKGFKVIKDMVVRGAPAIAIVAVLSLGVELSTKLNNGSLPVDASEYIISRLNYLVQARPTAVNLSDAVSKFCNLVQDKKISNKDLVEIYLKAAEKMLIDDVCDNTAIGEYGAKWILDATLCHDKKLSLITICNTGSLATAGYGTALGIVRSLHAIGKLQCVYPLETRPYNQGARLTAFELVHDEIPATLVTDSMASALAKLHPEIRAVVVGADRVAKNGDTANKIGTYQLAVIAKYHNLKFVVAAPTTSIDLNTQSGDDIIIEERSHNELVRVTGPQVITTNDDDDGGQPSFGDNVTIQIAATGINVWNPAFDVTPKDLIDAIVTEKGVFEKNARGSFNLESLLSPLGSDDNINE